MNLVKGNISKYAFFIFLSIIAAFGNMAVIYIFNDIIQNIIGSSSYFKHQYFIYFITALAVFFICRFFVSLGIIGFTQHLLGKTRLEVMDIVLKSAYFPLLASKSKVHNAMTRDVGNVVNASISVVDIITNIIIVIIAFAYLAVLDFNLFLCVLVLMLVTVGLYIASERKGRKFLDQAMTREDTFIKYLNETLSGFKEIIIDRKKGRAIKSMHIDAAIDQVINLNKRAFVIFLNNRIIGQIAFYLFIGLVLLYLGDFFQVGSGILVSFLFTVMYVFGPIETIIVLIPSLSQALSSINRLGNLQQDLLENNLLEEEDLGEFATFQSLKMRNVVYRYKADKENDKPFEVGPLDFQLESNKIYFVSGGNGSGKTTLINLVVGLYASNAGSVFVNDELVEKTTNWKYRSLFAPVFSDFHLFDRCYGIDAVDSEKLQAYLSLFDLESKVSYENGSFPTISLSAGQRKRLALICALLEEKPIIVLDEFAADQDPEFRRKFYLEILPFIKEEGFTVIAITHDDYYYHCCDYRYNMKDGLIESKESPGQKVPLSIPALRSM